MPWDDTLYGIPAWDLSGPGEWWGQPRSYKVGLDLAPGDDWVGFVPIEPQPSFEERKERCELMGMVFCNCTLDNGRVVVYNPGCPVHQHYCKL